MPLGPVFNAELITTARRPRYYVIRFVYGLILLLQVYLSYQANSSGELELSIHDMATFGQDVFNAFAIVQAVAVILLTPALVGGSIAEEKQRKTLHYLLTSELSSAEIILGKLAARLLQVLVLVALGLPVVSLIGLFGGVDFPLLLLTYGGTFTTIYFLASASIFVSVISRRPREAISMLYILEFLWLIVPTLLMVLLPSLDEPWPTVGGWINPVLQFLALTSPLYLTTPTGAGDPYTSAAWGMGLQVAYGTLFVILAAARLRPSYRAEGGRRGWLGRISWINRKRRWFPRPACGDDAMLWKELQVARTGGLAKITMVFLGVSLMAVLAYAGYDFLNRAIREIWDDGYFHYGNARRDFNAYLRGISTTIYCLWFLGVASASATTLTSEREEDQWISLLATPLSGSEILRAKMLGPVWGLRLVAYLLFLIWLIGLCVGAIHPFGVVVALVEFVVFTWFIVALGTFFSLRTKNSTRALAITMALLIFLNGGYLFCCVSLRLNNNVISAGATPFLFAMSLLSVQDFAELSSIHQSGQMVAATVLGLLFYSSAATALTTSLFQSFDAVVDRPDRAHQNRTPHQQREFLKGRLKPTDKDLDLG